MNSNNNASKSSIDQSIKLPDYFGCDSCVVVRNSRYIPFVEHSDGAACRQMQQAGRCRAELLKYALQSGAVQIHLHMQDDNARLLK